MRKVGVIALVLATLAAQHGAQAQAASSVAALVKRAGPAVVLVRSFDERSQALGFGSGFVASDGRVVTNAHVVAGASTVEVVGADGSLLLTTQFAEALSVRYDIAVLSRVSSRSQLSLAPDVPAVGEHIAVIGAPEGLSNTVSDGIVSAVRQLRGRTLIQVTAPISHGSSGGPVMDLSGRVIGIATASLSEGQNLNFAVNANDIRAMLSGPVGRYSFPPAEKAEVASALPAADVPAATPPLSGVTVAANSPSTPLVSPLDLIAAMPMISSQTEQDVEVKFYGCKRNASALLGGSPVSGCVIRVTNLLAKARDAFMLRDFALVDAAGFAGRPLGIISPALNPDQMRKIPLMWNMAKGESMILVVLFQGIPTVTPTGGTFRMGMWIAFFKGTKHLEFANAIVP